ncbi:hypothetical protein WAE56_07530 [Iodobacter sp. LRB]|uniref:hypothetical protein n=1 Tax=unclassified Iodobacter TaxID=235634 RepID=UPI000C112AE6|nr:hypothetical protein [Iodobacter sp. BJB302]PHV02532.1 hypothetical protein CSQ88_06295 [Iodobacter sp. BJB302]
MSGVAYSVAWLNAESCVPKKIEVISSSGPQGLINGGLFTKHACVLTVSLAMVKFSWLATPYILKKHAALFMQTDGFILPAKNLAQ